MLIYNFQKEFLGIDEDDLKALGFDNLQELRAESADFADMFVKTPGHVHNFTHVHWIDFVTYSDYNEDSKVIIHANNKNYKCRLNIKTAYLVDNPSEKAYLVNLSNLVELTTKENEQISKDIYDKPVPVSTTASNPIFNTPEFETNYESESIYESDISEKSVVVDEYDKYEAPITKVDEKPALKVIQDDFIEKPIVEDFTQDVDLEISTEDDKDYKYDPMVASKALGLPVDLIEEFLQDFIIQSKEFRVELYDSIQRDDLSNVKILSHKLKGVAANLRVEDALDTLTIINSSDDSHEIKASLTSFYKIISHLSGESPVEDELSKPTDTTQNQDVVPPKPIEAQTASIEEEDEFIISFKDEFEETPTNESTVVNKNEENEEILEFKNEFVNEFEEEFKDEFIDEFEEIIPEDKKEENLGIEFNKNLIAAEIGLDIESYNELLKDYIQENLIAVESINKAIAEGDYQMWKKHALKLKGMSDNMRIDIFMHELEDIISSQDTDVAKKAVHDIATKVKQISLGED